MKIYPFAFFYDHEKFWSKFFEESPFLAATTANIIFGGSSILIYILWKSLNA